MPLMSFHTQRGSAAPGSASELMPHDHGPGDPVLQGVLKRLLDRLEAAGGSLRPSPQTGYVVPFDPEIFKLVTLDLLDEAGVRVLLYAFASGVIGAPRPDGVVFDTKSGPIVITARAIVAAPGDGDVAALGGRPSTVGRAGDAGCSDDADVYAWWSSSGTAFAAYRQAHPDQWRRRHGLSELVRQASGGRELALARQRNILFFGTPHERELSVNSTRVTGALGHQRCWDLTMAEWQARRQMKQIVAFCASTCRASTLVPGPRRGDDGVRETRASPGTNSSPPTTSSARAQGRRLDRQRTLPALEIHNPQGKGPC